MVLGSAPTSGRCHSTAPGLAPEETLRNPLGRVLAVPSRHARESVWVVRGAHGPRPNGSATGARWRLNSWRTWEPPKKDTLDQAGWDQVFRFQKPESRRERRQVRWKGGGQRRVKGCGHAAKRLPLGLSGGAPPFIMCSSPWPWGLIQCGEAAPSVLRVPHS